MTIVVLTPPDLPSLDDVKDHLVKAHIKVDDSEEDALIRAYLCAVVAHIDGPDGTLGRCVLPQRLEYWPACVAREIVLPCGPVTEVEEVVYSPSGGAPVIYGAASLRVRANRVSLASGEAWPAASEGELSIKYKAGAETLHPSIQAAVFLMVGDLYAHRETVVVDGARAEPLKTPASVENLLWPFRALNF